MTHAFVYDGLYSEHRKRTFGSSTEHNPAHQFIVFSQNHDQTGNRMLGERLTELVSYEMLKVVAGLVIMSPYLPMLFMGEEYGEKNPFLYFVSHSDKDLIEAVRKGRKKEFSAFAWQGEAPDPQSEKTFNRSKLNHSYTSDPKQLYLREFYKKLIYLRKSSPALSAPDKNKLVAQMDEHEKVLHLIHLSDKPYIYCLFNISNTPKNIRLNQNQAKENWQVMLSSADSMWGGPGHKFPKEISGQEEITLPAETILILQQQK